MALICDGLLVLGLGALLTGPALIAWGCVANFAPVRMGTGVGLVVVGALVLLLWERLAWEPFGDRLSRLS